MLKALGDQLIKFSPLLFILSIFTMINGEICNPISCPTRNSMNTKDAPFVSVQYPFRLTNQQPLSCGQPGLDLYCDFDQGGTFIDLPNNVTLRVNSTFYNSKEIFLTDPEDCLLGKLISLNLTGTRFRTSESFTKWYSVYNCSGSNFTPDRVECLSGSNHSVIVTTTGSRFGVDELRCKFIKSLTIPYHYSKSIVTGLSGTYLTWNGVGLAFKPSSMSSKRASITPVVGVVFGFLGIIVITMLFCCCRCFCKNSNGTENPRRITTTTAPVAGLDKITIDSYPVVVLGESGRLVKPDDNTCAICLSDYCANETLKIMPQCLHRFHVECIDQWLGSKGICPICRNPTPCNSTPPNQALFC